MEGIPQELKDYPHWAVVKQGEKIPVNPNTMKRASSTNPRTWVTFEEAIEANKNNPNIGGVGFMLSANDPFTVIDIDNCVEEDGLISTKFAPVIKLLDSYTEYSRSGKGIHGFIKGRKSHKKSKKNGIELYDTSRFIIVTGNRYPNTPETVNERQEQIEEIEVTYLTAPVRESAWTGELVSPPMSDEDVIRLVRNKSEFALLFDEGDKTQYEGDDSSADLALCSRVAYFTQDEEQIDRIFRKSKLVRDKWIDREDYRDRTIQTALESCYGFFTPETQETSENIGKKYRLLTVEEFAQNSEEAEWLWDKTIALGALTIIQAPPKAGKSTLIRCFMASVLTGEELLGRTVKKGENVLYMPFEERPGDILSHLKKLGVHDHPGLKIVVTQEDDSMIDSIETLERVIEEVKPILVVFDPIIPFLKNIGINEYDKVYPLLLKFVKIAEKHNCSITYAHHEKKGADMESTTGYRSIGSAAFAGTAHTIISYQGKGNKRRLEMQGRNIEEFGKHMLHLDNGKLLLASPIDIELQNELEDEIYQVVLDLDQPQTRYMILKDVPGDPKLKGYAFNTLVDRARIQVAEGKGVKGSPYLYSV